MSDPPRTIGMRHVLYLSTAMFYLALARLDFGCRSAPRIIAALREVKPAAGPRTGLDLALVTWAMGAAARRVPWRSDCLIQSLAASRWLRRNGITPDFRLAVAQKPEGGILAHAWIEAEGSVITGGQSVSDMHVLIAS